MRRRASGYSNQNTSQVGRSRPEDLSAPLRSTGRLRPGIRQLMLLRDRVTPIAAWGSGARRARGEDTRQTFGAAARLVPGLVLIETPVRIARCLANVQPPSPMSPHIMHA